MIAAKKDRNPGPFDLGITDFDALGKEHYAKHLNGFSTDHSDKRGLIIDGRTIAIDYTRIVIADIGAFVELDPKSLIVPLSMSEDESWRVDIKYLQRVKHTPTHLIYNIGGVPVTQVTQWLPTGDFKIQMYYISVDAFDTDMGDAITRSHHCDTLEDALASNAIWTHTDTASAEAFLEEMGTMPIDKINIAVVGDESITDKSQVSRCISMAVKMFGSVDNIRLLTGECQGVEAITRKYARKNNFELDLYPVLERPEWFNGEPSKNDRDWTMLNAAQCVIVITKLGSKECNFMYKAAVSSGRFVTKRIVRTPKVDKQLVNKAV